jgi:hypothetical protein
VARQQKPWMRDHLTRDATLLRLMVRMEARLLVESPRRALWIAAGFV